MKRQIPLVEIDPSTLPSSDCYKLLVGAITPRPIAFVSTISPSGEPNLAPFSFFSGVGSNPMMLMFCPANDNEGRDKDSLQNAKPREEGGQGQFVVNVVTEEYVAEMSAASEALPYGESEFNLTGLKTAPSHRVEPPRVLKSPVAFECETHQVVRTNQGVRGGGNIVIGRVVHVFIADGLADERLRIDPTNLETIGRLAGNNYCRTTDRFRVTRGRAALSEGVLPFE